MLTNPNSFIEQILQHAAEKSFIRDEGTEQANNTDAEATLAEALGGRLAEFLNPDAASEEAEEDTSSEGIQALPSEKFFAEIAERNAVLAEALGACLCWGEHVNCDICGGTGTSGWTSPNRQLFALYVRPAILAMRGRK